MKIGMVGLGRMGANMAQRLIMGGHDVVAFDASDEPRKALAAKGAKAVESLSDVVAQLPAPRVVWLMIPAGKATDDALA
jgi:6-phosphogluconate dehydrogenase